MFAKMSLLFCFFCIRLFGTNNVCVIPYGVLRNLDAIYIRVRMVLCETSMLLCFVLIRVFRELDRYGLARVKINYAYSFRGMKIYAALAKLQDG